LRQSLENLQNHPTVSLRGLSAAPARILHLLFGTTREHCQKRSEPFLK